MHLRCRRTRTHRVCRLAGPVRWSPMSSPTRETQNDAVPNLLSAVAAAEGGSSWSPTDAVASCLVAHFMGIQDAARRRLGLLGNRGHIRGEQHPRHIVDDRQAPYPAEAPSGRVDRDAVAEQAHG